jgi:uncharacterized membrane protein YfcA
MHVSLQLIAALLVVGLAAGVKGALGFGFPLIAVPVLASVVGPRIAVVALTIPSLVANVMILARSRRERWEAWVLWLLGGLMAGAAGGAELVSHISPRALALVVGLLSLAILAGGPLLERLGAQERTLRRFAPLAGLAGGLLGGTTDMYSPILAAYLQLLRVAKDRFVVLISVFFLMGGGVQTATFALSHMFTRFDLGLGVLSCLPMAAGTWTGITLRPRLQSRAFRLAVTALIAATALNLVRAGIWGA